MLWKPEKMNVKVHKITSYIWNFQNFSCVFTILVKFDIHFLGLPWGIFFGVITDDYLHLQPLKNVKKNAIFFRLFWFKVFVHWELKLFNFLVDSVLSICLSRFLLPNSRNSRWTKLNSIANLCTSSTFPIMHVIWPPKFCITFVFHFSWDYSQEKLKTMLMQNFGGK